MAQVVEQLIRNQQVMGSSPINGFFIDKVTKSLGREPIQSGALSGFEREAAEAGAF